MPVQATTGVRTPVVDALVRIVSEAGTPVGQRFLLVAEVARIVNPDPDVVSPNLLYRLIQADQLPAIKIGDRRKYAVPALALDLVVARVLGAEPPPTVGLARGSAAEQPVGDARRP